MEERDEDFQIPKGLSDIASRSISSQDLPPKDRAPEEGNLGEDDPQNYRLDHSYGYRYQTISEDAFIRLNGWSFRDMLRDPDFDDWPSICIEFLGIWMIQEFQDKTFREILQDLAADLGDKHKDLLRDHEVDFQRLNSLRKTSKRSRAKTVDLIIAAEGTKGQWCENRYLITSFIIKQCGS